MAKTKEINKELNALKDNLKDKKKVIIGAERILKELKAKKLSKVFLASNCPNKIRDDVCYYANLAKIPVVESDINNEELGVFCKKNFFISVLGVLKE